METYVSALNYGIPLFVLLILIERIVAGHKNEKVIRSMDTLSSLSSGLTNVIKDVLGLSVVIISYSWLVENLAVIQIEATWMVYFLAFLGLDFAGYWVHRIQHSVNYFWNHHIVHHSSEEFNLGCALRQSISSWFSITFIFLIPIAMLGIPAKVIGLIAPIHLFAQFWYHTRLIGKMGILENIIVTPSHHRVHHAINTEYLDKNLGQILIIWDKLFGTFQKEREDIPPVYGVKRAPNTWNPFIINFMHLWQLIKDAWYTQSWTDKLRIWFMPTGWRPSDVIDKFPIQIIDDPYSYKKYDPPSNSLSRGWSWSQYVINFVFMMFLFNRLAEIGAPGMFVYGAFLFLSIFSFTMFMDGDRFSWMVEAIKSVIGISIILWTGDWFTLKQLVVIGPEIMMLYFVISPILDFVLSRKFGYKDLAVVSS